MQIENGICKLCGKQERVFYDSGITNDIKTEFLPSVEIYSRDLEQFRTCPTCAYKVQLSCTMKKNHGKPLRREAKPAQLCAFCGTQDGILLKTDDSPSDFKSEMNKFVKSSNRADYEKSLVCLQCLFGINVWTETQSRIFATLGISVQDEVENNNSIESAKEMMIVSPEVEETRSNLRSLPSRNLTTPEIQNIAPEKIPRTKNLNSKRTLSFRNRLIQAISVKDLEAIKFADSIKGDHKLYFDVPYVSVQKTKLANLEGTARQKSLPLKWSHIVSSPRDYDVNRHLCQVCDKSFVTKCEYLSHRLKHEKVEELVINVKRLRVDKEGKVQMSKKKPCLLPTETVNQLLTKYLGDSIVIDDSPLVSEGEDRPKEKKSDEPEEQYLKLKRKRFQFKINLNKKKKKLKANKKDEKSKESLPLVQEDNEKTKETIINEVTNQNDMGSEMDKIANDVPKDIESTPSKRRNSSDSDDITPAVSPLRVTESSEAEDGGIKVIETSDKDQWENAKENKEIIDDVPMDVDTSTEVERKEETDLNSSSRLLHAEENSPQPQSTEDVEMPTSEKEEEDVAFKVPVVVEDEAANNAEVVTEENLDKATIENVSSSQDAEKSSEDTGEEVPRSPDIEEVPQSREVCDVPQSQECEENEEASQSEKIEAVPQNQECEENEEASQSEKIEAVPQSKENTERSQSEGTEEVSPSQEIEEESRSQEDVEGSRNQEKEGTKEGTESTQSELISDILDKLNEATTETENDVIIVDEESVREEREGSPTLTKLKKRRMTTVVEVMDVTISDDDDDDKVVEVLEGSEKNRVETKTNKNVSDEKNECVNTISLLDEEEVIIEEDVIEEGTKEKSGKKDNEESSFEKTKENDDKDSKNLSKDSSSSEEAVLKEVEMLGEAVVWSTQSDSDSDQVEPDSSPTLNDDNITDEELKTTSNNAPIMTNEDLLNILGDNDVIGGKRKRSSDTETSTSKKARIEGEEGTSWK